ncbi:MAG TPA: methionyl-tRNA formyltransferase [Steroidobacteraceae bacterium]|nr:methionyl-tRNA formyltransferase [Steroidobacteraceae bacterium]
MSPFPRQLRVVFAGTPAFAVPALDALIEAGHEICAVYTQPDRPSGRGRKLTASAVKTRALVRRLHIEQPSSMKSPESAERLSSLTPDAMVVVAYGQILPQAVLDVPRLGCFNIHASLLPRWRGAAPIQHAILAGDPRTGVSIMRMTQGLDSGPVIAQRELRIDPQMSAGELHDALAPLGASLMVEALEQVAGGHAAPREQNAGDATHAPKIVRGDAHIDWNASAERIERQVRAYDPWPGAESSWRGGPLKIWRAQARDRAVNAPAGEILQADAGGIEVACGTGVLALLALQLPGRNRVTAADFVHAHAMTGDRLI